MFQNFQLNIVVSAYEYTKWNLQNACQPTSSYVPFVPIDLEKNKYSSEGKKYHRFFSEFQPNFWYNQQLCSFDGGILSLRSRQTAVASFIGIVSFSWEIPAKLFPDFFGEFGKAMHLVGVEFNTSFNSSFGEHEIFLPTTVLPQCFWHTHLPENKILTDHTFCKMKIIFTTTHKPVEVNKSVQVKYLEDQAAAERRKLSSFSTNLTLYTLVPMCNSSFSSCVEQTISWKDAKCHCSESGLLLPSIHSKGDIDNLFFTLSKHNEKFLSKGKFFTASNSEHPHRSILYQPLGVYIGLQVVLVFIIGFKAGVLV